MARLEVRNLSRRFGGITAVDDVTFDVADGEFCVILGPSGCGKSTLLRIVSGLEATDGGAVRIDGDDVTDRPPRERDVAFVFQSYALYPHLTVRGNLEFPLRARRVPAAERRRRVDEAARLLGIGELLDRRPRQLSGGQRQRVAMGRAVVRQPRLFLFDEPLSNLDAKLRARMRVELAELHRTLAATIVYVTHDQSEALGLGQRIVVMEEGRIRQIGSPRDVYDRPADPFVAGFVGSPSMNLVEGEVHRTGTENVFRWSGGETVAPESVPEGEVTLGIRPEDLVPSGGGMFRCRVRLVEDVGAERFVHGGVGNVDVVFRLPGDAAVPSVGEVVPLTPRPGRLQWFSGGRRVELSGGAGSRGEA